MYDSLAKHALSGRYLVRPRLPNMDCKIDLPYLVPSSLVIPNIYTRYCKMCYAFIPLHWLVNSRPSNCALSAPPYA
jgi:hypothetical protein